MADNSSWSFTNQVCSSSFKKRRSIDEQTSKNLRPLVSIEYVRVNKIDDEFDEEDKEEFDDEFYSDLNVEDYILDYAEKTMVVYGTVIVTDCRGNDLLYHRYLGYSDRIKEDEHISLVGPSRPISGCDKFIISVNLWARVWVPIHREREAEGGGGGGEEEEEEEEEEDDDDEVIAMDNLTISDDVEIHIDQEIARGEIEWDLRTPDQFSYEKLVQADVSGKRGSVTVGYLVMREALTAAVKVVLMTESIPQFYGTIKAVRLFGGLSTTTRTLFNRSMENPQSGTDPSLHLTRPTFAVAVDSCLRIEVDLWKYEEGNCSPDYQFAMGKLLFDPIFGQHMKSIPTENNGVLQVYITCE